MSDNQSAFVGSIPEHYDRIGPILFADSPTSRAAPPPANQQRCWRPLLAPVS